MRLRIAPSSMKGKKMSLETRKKMSENRKGENNGNFGKRHANMHSDEFKKKIGEIARISKTGKPGATKGKKINLSESDRLRRIEHAKRTNEKGFENKGGRCQFFQVDGVIIQGRYELAFYLGCLEKPKRAPRIKTPFGWYSPDFEFEDRFVEIKSTYTIKTCIANGQYKKIAWVRKNIKNIEIKVLNEEETRLFLLQHDISKLRY